MNIHAQIISVAVGCICQELPLDEHLALNMPKVRGLGGVPLGPVHLLDLLQTSSVWGEVVH